MLTRESQREKSRIDGHLRPLSSSSPRTHTQHVSQATMAGTQTTVRVSHVGADFPNH